MKWTTIATTLFLAFTQDTDAAFTGSRGRSHVGSMGNFVSVNHRLVSGTDLNAAATKKSASKKTSSKKTASKKSKTVAAKEETFRKGDFVTSIIEKTGLTKAESESALNAVLEIIQEEVSAGKKVSMIGFGSFKLTHRAARKGRNPKTGEEIDIKASKSPSFSASKPFKERCNK